MKNNNICLFVLLEFWHYRHLNWLLWEVRVLKEEEVFSTRKKKIEYKLFAGLDSGLVLDALTWSKKFSCTSSFIENKTYLSCWSVRFFCWKNMNLFLKKFTFGKWDVSRGDLGGLGLRRDGCFVRGLSRVVLVCSFGA